MAGADVLAFVEAAECEREAEDIANKLLDFGGAKPTEDEVLARSRMVFEFILHRAILQVNGFDRSDLKRFEVEIQTCES